MTHAGTVESMWKPEPCKEVCIKLRDNNSCQVFNIPSNGFSRLSVWAHEFSELGIKEWVLEYGSEREIFVNGNEIANMPLNTIYMRKKIRIELPSGEEQYHRFDHVLTSLVTLAIFSSDEGDQLVTPDEYAKAIRGVPVIYLGF